jgi:hypothetical protein
MRAVALALGLLLLAACMPQGPTGQAVAGPTHWVDGSSVLVKAQVFDSLIGDPTVRITVVGDIVYERVIINGEEHVLAGQRFRGQWLSERGSVVVRLPPGEYSILAYSCFERFSGWDCGCQKEGDCGHWMERSLRVLSSEEKDYLQ